MTKSQGAFGVTINLWLIFSSEIGAYYQPKADLFISDEKPTKNDFFMFSNIKNTNRITAINKVEGSLTMSEVFLKVYKIFYEFIGENGYEIKEENVCWAIGYKMAENYARELLKNKGETDQILNELFEKGVIKYEKYSVKVEDRGDYFMICQSHVETQMKLQTNLKNVPLYTFRISIPQRALCKGVFISDKRSAEFYILGKESISIHVKTVLREVFGIEKRKANYIIRRYKDDLLTQSLFHIFVPSSDAPKKEGTEYNNYLSKLPNYLSAKITSKKEGTIDLTKYFE